MLDDITKLDQENWQSYLERIYEHLKPSLQGDRGYIKKYKDYYHHDERRKEELLTASNDFLSHVNISNLDMELNEYGSEIYRINKSYQNILFHDYMKVLDQIVDLYDVSEMSTILDAINGENTVSLTIRHRLHSIISRIFMESASQGNKSQAGVAGEDIVLNMLEAIGLEKNVAYKTQHKSVSGSDTDFVFPYVEDNRDQDVEIFLGTQMSSNDRTRLIDSELKPGGQKYLFTCNGMSFAKKTIQDIGLQIINKLKDGNVKIVCYKPELESEVDRLKLNPTKNNVQRLDYIENFTITLGEFGAYLKDRYGTK